MHIPKVLVLGASGRIGRILRQCWLKEQVQEQVLWQARHQLQEQSQEQSLWFDAGQADWAVLDPLAQPEALAQAAQGREAILCLSGVVQAGVVQGRQPEGKLSDNIALAEAAIHAGAASGARVFLASSAAVYGNQRGLLDEGAPLNPVNDYGRSKAEMEVRGKALGAELGVPVCALRIGNIAGIDAILGGWKPGFRLDRFKDGRTPRRTYIGAQTLARVLGDLMGATGLPTALNIVSPGLVEMGALLDAAGLAWTPQPASQTAIAEVRLSTAALARFTSLPASTSAASLVAEWNALKELPA
jgi:UDP-glucose 4-epimerase